MSNSPVTKEALKRIFMIIGRRLSQDNLQIRAGYLAFVTLLSIVPLLSVFIAVLSAFSVFNSLYSDLKEIIYNNFVPDVAEILEYHLQTFLQNASKVSLWGLAILIFLSFALMSAVDKSINHIFRVITKRRILFQMMSYWTMLTLGPILFAISMAVEGYLEQSIAEMHTYFFSILTFLKNMLFSFFVFLLLYLVVPNRWVPVRYAAAGALFTTIVFEVSRIGFKFYMAHVPMYWVVYGTLGIIPLLFIWIYVLWFIIFSGAEITIALIQIFADKEGEEPRHDTLDDL